MRNTKQRVVLKVHTFSLPGVNACAPEGSAFGPVLFLIYRNDLADNLSNAKLSADDTSLFSIVHNVNTSPDEVNNDLVKINNWANQWKMICNSDPIKQAQGVIFTRKIDIEEHPPLDFEQ